MNMSDIREFRTTWKRDLFRKNKSTCFTAKCLIKKSIAIAQARSCRQLNHLTIELQTAHRDRQLLDNYRNSNSLAEHLKQRLQTLQNEMDNYNHKIKNLAKQEKDYWKQLSQTIETRMNEHRPAKTEEQIPSNTRPIVVVNATFVINDENIPPLECKAYDTEKKSNAKVPKTRRKKKCIS